MPIFSLNRRFRRLRRLKRSNRLTEKQRVPHRGFLDSLLLRIPIRPPQTNGVVERLNQTIQEEFYKVAFRKKLYSSLGEIQNDLDVFMQWYNKERTNQGRYCQGRTPMQTFIDGLPLYQEYVYEEVEAKIAT